MKELKGWMKVAAVATLAPGSLILFSVLLLLPMPPAAEIVVGIAFLVALIVPPILLINTPAGVTTYECGICYKPFLPGEVPTYNPLYRDQFGPEVTGPWAHDHCIKSYGDEGDRGSKTS